MFFSIILILTSKYSEVDNAQTYQWRVINDNLYLKLNQIRSKYPDESVVVMTPLLNTPAIYPVARQKAQAIIPAQLGANYGQQDRIRDNLRYYNKTTSESERKAILKRWNVSVVVE